MVCDWFMLICIPNIIKALILLTPSNRRSLLPLYIAKENEGKQLIPLLNMEV